MWVKALSSFREEIPGKATGEMIMSDISGVQHN